MILIGILAAILACAAALIWGDGPLRAGGAIIALCWATGVVCQLLRIQTGPDFLAGSDSLCAIGLAILLCTTEFRVWVLAALVAQLLMILLHLTVVQVEGRHLYSYVVEYNLLNTGLLLAMSGGVAAAVGKRRAVQTLARRTPV